MKTRMLQRPLAAVLLVSLFLVVPAVLRAADEVETLSWPRQLDGEQGRILIYQPQFEDYTGNMLKARAAVSVTPKGETEPAFGSIWFDARLSTDKDARVASLESIEITDARFPNSTQEELRFLTDYLEDEIPRWEMVMSIDRLVAGMETLGEATDATPGLNHEPPTIMYATEPTVLVTIDGEPILEELEGANLRYVVNTPFYVLQDPDTDRFYLRGGGHWYTADDILGEWRVASSLPGNVSAVAEEVERKERERTEELSSDPWETDPALLLTDAPAPRIVVTTTPAEVVETDGEPMFAPVEGTNLLYLQNSESDIIMDIRSQNYFILLAGRWYTSDSLSDGDWTHVPPDGLPSDFWSIPPDSEMATVRASIPGTEEAAQAVAENLIPQTAEVDRHTASVTVTYDGDPEFEWCTDEVAYARNTDKTVLFVDDAYYCCDEAVWFASDYPDGPWFVATEVPGEIQDIPPSCPAYNVRYVHIYDVTPDVVYVGYTPAYLGSYIYDGCVVYGTGYWYRPWYRSYYYPRPVTWGYGAHWRPYTGWGFYFGVSFGWLDVWFGRPWYTGWWGPCGYVYGYRHGYHHGYYHGYHDGYWDGYHDGYWDSYYAGYHPGHHSELHATDIRNLFVKRPKGISRTGIVHEYSATEGGKQPHPKGDDARVAARPAKRAPKTPETVERKDLMERQVAREAARSYGDEAASRTKYEPATPAAVPVKVKKPKPSRSANDIYAAPDGKVYKEKKGNWEKVDKSRRVSPRSSRPAKPTRKELDKHQKARRRGDEMAKKFRPRNKPEKPKAQEPRRPADKKAKPKSGKKPESTERSQPKRSERRPPPRASK
ncbi:MAG: hypothetical protein GF400_08720 [Candidatus Eisenbacteria bacterium]|nr:hypothetical protein [Candidatus Eisenbacteria bacterium]